MHVMCECPLFQYIALLVTSLSIICTGMHFGWASIALPKLLDENSKLTLTGDEGSWVVVMVSAGGMLGSSVSIVLLDKIGRKNLMLVASIFLLVGWIIIAYANSFWMLIVGRLIGGIGVGKIYCSIPVYLTEIASSNNRGFMGSCISVSNILGVFFINVMGLFYSLFTTAVIGASFALLSLLTVCGLPKSPYYLIMKNKPEQAKESLTFFNFNSTCNIDDEFIKLSLAVKAQTENSGKYIELFTVASNRRALYVTLVTRGVQQLSGISAISFYINLIFMGFGSDSVLYSYGSIIYFGIQVILSGISSVVVDKVGRKPLMIFSLGGSSFALFVLSSYFFIDNLHSLHGDHLELIPIIALIFYVISFNMGMCTIPLLITGEIFPTNLKGFAIGLSDVYFNVVTIIATKLFQLFKDSYGLHVPFIVFFICSVLGCVFIALFVPETKGKTLEEIQELFKNKSK